MLSIVLVTYNRLDKLKHALSCYDSQTRQPDVVIVVDNCSTDGTNEYLESWKRQRSEYQKEVIRTDENLGGSGGFYLGQKRALELQADWVFVADDDAYAEPDLLSRFYAYLQEHDCSGLSAISSSVLCPDGTIDFKHRDRFVILPGYYFRRESVPLQLYGQESFKIDLLSYVGAFLNARALREVGMVDPDYFIYFDDSEHSFRLAKWGDIICVPTMKVIHDVPVRSPETVEDPVVHWQDYYFYRNELHMVRRHFPLVGLNYFRIRFAQLYWYKTERGTRAKVLKQAFWDAFLGRLGKHSIYRPI